MFIFERYCVSRGGAERGGDTESEAGSRLSSQRLMQGSNSRTTKSSPVLKLDSQPTEPPRHPNKGKCNVRMKGVSVVTIFRGPILQVKKLRPRTKKNFPKATQLGSDRGRTKPAASAYQSSVLCHASGMSHICYLLQESFLHLREVSSSYTSKYIHDSIFYLIFFFCQFFLYELIHFQEFHLSCIQETARLLFPALSSS